VRVILWGERVRSGGLVWYGGVSIFASSMLIASIAWTRRTLSHIFSFESGLWINYERSMDSHAALLEGRDIKPLALIRINIGPFMLKNKEDVGIVII
jgi:hypothetical protein